MIAAQVPGGGGWIRTSVGLPRRIYSRCALFEFIGKKGRKFATGVRQPAAISCDGVSAGRRLPASRYEPPLGRRIEIWVDEVGGAAEAFKKRLPERVAEVRAAHPGKRIELWFQDEARIWQKNKLTRRWAKRGTRPSAPHDQRTKWAARHCPRTNGGQWLAVGAICPAEGKGAGIVMPFCDTPAMQEHLAAISAAVAQDAHAVLILDQAGWHLAGALVVPRNITILPLPPRSPDLNPVENIWQFMRDNWLSNRVFKGYDDIVAHCCAAWNNLVDQPWRIRSIGKRSWAEGF